MSLHNPDPESNLHESKAHRHKKVADHQRHKKRRRA
jgi:hypothetical protein